MAETWVIYKASTDDAPGWQERLLMPSGSLTSILSEEFWYNEDLPQVGDRVYESRRVGDEVEARDGDWLVNEVEVFSRADSSQLVICTCTYAPVAPQWERLERGAPIPLEVAAV
ncbi:hypothetical protein PGN35_008140 [Nodosilinea sp. PGN35]|uniref:hypothetical protein n=1 Tax=Nodosilinea sp. PGN35 TaxID=3020489 RepID=UPI00398B867D